MSRKGRVLVAMSGGIDSTATAMMMHEQGYEVVGITMKTWDYAQSGGSKKETGCCSLDSINDARAVAVKMGFHHFIVDIREEFGDYVIDNFVDEYLSGRTPNPCVLCNTHIKWSSLLKRADSLDCEFIATGHYAVVNAHEGRKYVTKSADLKKDQSYVLWGLTQECLDRTLFTKQGMKNFLKSPKVLKFALCLITIIADFYAAVCPIWKTKCAVDSLSILKVRCLGRMRAIRFIQLVNAKVWAKPLVNRCLSRKLFPKQIPLSWVKLFRNGMTVGKINLQKYATIPDGLEAITQIRYNDGGTIASLKNGSNGNIEVDFFANVKGVAPGQSAVFYEGDDIIGGGIIMNSQLN
jgi:tRNA-uridine 2-sulfurtransferase